MQKICYLLVLSIFLLGSLKDYCYAENKDDEIDLKKAIIEVFTTYQKPDYYMPWQMLPHRSRSGSGCVISGNRIITNAHVVSDHTFIQVRKAGEVDRYTAEVEYIAHDCDLALLRVKDRSFFKGVQQVKIGDLPKLRDKVSVYGFPVGGRKLAITEGVVSRIEIGTYSHSSQKLLTMQVDASVSAGNSGGPVFKNKLMVGIAFQGIFDTGEAIPVPIIKHFLRDVQDGVYNGSPYLGIDVQTLENPAMRLRLKMKAHQTGVYVRGVEYNTTAWPHLRRGDVLLEIDGISIANDGTIPFSEDRLKYVHLAVMHQLGEMVELTLLRNGRIVNKKIPLKKIFRFVPHTRYEKRPTYYIYAGLVFTPLTENFLDRWGKWDDVPTHLRNYYYYRKASRNREQVIVLAHILAHDVNNGYQKLTYRILTHVNGKNIENMTALKRILEETTGPYMRIDLENGTHIVIDTNLARKALPTILNNYRIKSHRSDDLR